MIARNSNERKVLRTFSEHLKSMCHGNIYMRSCFSQRTCLARLISTNTTILPAETWKSGYNYPKVQDELPGGVNLTQPTAVPLKYTRKSGNGIAQVGIVLLQCIKNSVHKVLCDSSSAAWNVNKPFKSTLCYFPSESHVHRFTCRSLQSSSTTSACGLDKAWE